jgi:hypothetical protein
MSAHNPTSFGVLPSSLPHFNFQSQIHNYFLIRSFQQNWSIGSILHYPISRPFGSTPAGEHHFQWRVPGNPSPICCVSFIVSPLFTTPFPVSFSNTRDGVRYIFILSNVIHPILPEQVEGDILTVGADSDIDISPFLYLLEDFLVDYFRPVSPVPLSPKPTLHPLTVTIPPTSPLGEH